MQSFISKPAPYTPTAADYSEPIRDGCSFECAQWSQALRRDPDCAYKLVVCHHISNRVFVRTTFDDSQQLAFQGTKVLDAWRNVVTDWTKPDPSAGPIRRGNAYYDGNDMYCRCDEEVDRKNDEQNRCLFSDSFSNTSFKSISWFV